MNNPRLSPRRSPDCTAEFHGRTGRRRHGCICPPTERDREVWRDASRRRATGWSRVRVSHSGDVDPIAVERLLRGESPRRITRAERLAAVAILTQRGHSLAQIAQRLSCHAHTVGRYRSLARQLTPSGRPS